MPWPKDVRKSDLRIDTYRGSGKGGQHRNKTDSAVRITHIPTGISAQAEDEREQPKNKKLAFRRLANKLIPIMKQQAKVEVEKRSEDRIRTYHEPRGTVIDHRLGKKQTFNLDEVLSGKLEDIHKALIITK